MDVFYLRDRRRFGQNLKGDLFQTIRGLEKTQVSGIIH